MKRMPEESDYADLLSSNAEELRIADALVAYAQNRVDTSTLAPESEEFKNLEEELE